MILSNSKTFSPCLKVPNSFSSIYIYKISMSTAWSMPQKGFGDVDPVKISSIFYGPNFYGCFGQAKIWSNSVNDSLVWTKCLSDHLDKTNYCKTRIAPGHHFYFGNFPCDSKQQLRWKKSELVVHSISGRDIKQWWEIE